MPPRRLRTITQFCEDNPAFRPGGIRWQIYKSNQNGLQHSGAIVRIGRRVYVDEDRYFDWVDRANGQGEGHGCRQYR